MQLRGTCGHCQQAKTSDLYVPHTSRPGLSDSDSDSSTVTSLHFHPTPVIIFLLLYHSAPCFSYPLPFNARGYLSLFVLRVSATNKVFHRAKSHVRPLRSLSLPCSRTTQVLHSPCHWRVAHSHTFNLQKKLVPGPLLCFTLPCSALLCSTSPHITYQHHHLPFLLTSSYMTHCTHHA